MSSWRTECKIIDEGLDEEHVVSKCRKDLFHHSNWEVMVEMQNKPWSMNKLTKNKHNDNYKNTLQNFSSQIRPIPNYIATFSFSDYEV